jgi:hypothetical protein
LAETFDFVRAFIHPEYLPGQRRSEALREFLKSTVPSYEELDILLLLRRESARTWSSAEAGAMLALSPDAALVALQKLREKGVLTSRARRGVQRFRFAPKTDALRHHVSRLAHLYVVDRAFVAEIMSLNSLERVRAAAAQTFANVLAAGAGSWRRE